MLDELMFALFEFTRYGMANYGMAWHGMCTAKHLSGGLGKGKGKREGRYAFRRAVSTRAFCEGKGERDDPPMGIARCGLREFFWTHSWEARRDTLR